MFCMVRCEMPGNGYPVGPILFRQIGQDFDIESGLYGDQLTGRVRVPETIIEGTAEA